MTNLLSVFSQVPTDETLIRTVEEGEKVFADEDVAQILPLFDGRVAAGGIMTASMQYDDATVRRMGKVLAHSIKVECSCFGRPVPIFCRLQSNMFQARLVVLPRLCWDEHSLWPIGELFEKSGA